MNTMKLKLEAQIDRLKAELKEAAADTQAIISKKIKELQQQLDKLE